MNTLEAMAKRRCYRGRYLPSPVPREDLVKILEAGCHAPSGCNKQTTSFLAVDDPAVLEQLRAVMKPKLGETAPALICVLTRKRVCYDNRSYHVQDYSAAIENLLLAITELGYASCWVEGYVTDANQVGQQMARILGVPEELELIAYLPVGIPADGFPPLRKKPFSQRVWFNRYRETM